jgi:Mce-associated membrane protein
VTAVLDDQTADTEAAPAVSYAGWAARAGAFVIDVVIGVLTIATLVLVAWATAQRSPLWWVCVVAAGLMVLAVLANRLLLPALTGWTLGRAALGVQVVDGAGRPAGPWRLLLRDLAHLLDTAAVFVGWLWPLWDSRRRTWADVLARTEVRRTVQRPRSAARRAGAAVGTAMVLALAAVAAGYVVVYQSDLRVAQAREQLAVQGPKLVEGMLSYDVPTLTQDFERAAGLVTDGYRDQLTAQQEAITAAGATANEYWTANSAVLTNTADRGTMLMALQGQRGVPPDQRFITATVRVDFEKVDSQWRVAGLTVLASPQRPPQ